MDEERKEHIQGSLLMGTGVCGMLIVFLGLAGYGAEVIAVLVSGVAGAFIAAGTVGPTEYLGMPGIRVIQGEITPSEALAKTVTHWVVLGLGFAGGVMVAVRIV